MAKDDEKEAKDAEKKGGKGKLIIIAVPLVLLIAGAAWFFVLKPKDKDTGPVTLPAPVAGVPVTLDPITINLAGAHFLKLGMALQPVAALKEAPDGSKALDLAIDQFSGAALDDLSSTEGRDRAKEELIARIKLAYLPEGTDLTTAFDGEPAATASSDSKDSKDSKESSKSSDKALDPKDLTEEKIEALTNDQAIELASKLSVQPDVYNVYLTEFVMQ